MPPYRASVLNVFLVGPICRNTFKQVPVLGLRAFCSLESIPQSIMDEWLQAARASGGTKMQKPFEKWLVAAVCKSKQLTHTTLLVHIHEHVE